MSEPDARGPVRVLVQFIKDWNTSSFRPAMIADSPNSDDSDVLASIAAVVSALCARDEVAVPSWVHRHQASAPFVLGGTSYDSRYGRWQRERAPDAAAEHGVFFDAELLERV